MFVCPKCGFTDLSCWKAHRYMLYVVYCRLDELEVFRPDLVKKLLETPDMEEGPYTYHITKPKGEHRYILRVPTDLKVFLYKRGVIERHKIAADFHQTKLLREEIDE